MSVFGIFDKMMLDGNKELKLSPLSNIKSVDLGKDGWGSVTIAMPSDVVSHFFAEDGYYVGGLLIAKREEFKKYEEDMNRKESNNNENEIEKTHS